MGFTENINPIGAGGSDSAHTFSRWLLLHEKMEWEGGLKFLG